MTLSTAVLIAIYFMIVYGFFRLGQFYERVKMRKEEQKKIDKMCQEVRWY